MNLGSRVVERSGDDGRTLVGVLDGSAPADIDEGGLVTPAGADWSVDWWIGADDRWYLPSREPTVRQNRIGSGPLIETVVRIPSGDARQVVYGALVAGREMTVIEVHNESPVPVALAMAVRPYGVGGRPASRPLTIAVDGRTVEVDSRPGLVLPRTPNESGGSATTDLVGTVSAGGALRWDAAECRGMVANAVVLYPLPHRTSLRFLVPTISDDATSWLDPATAPDVEAVARGWASVLDAAGRLEFPDSGLTGLVNGARARLLLAAGDLPDQLAEVRAGAGLILHALALCGHHRELGPSLNAIAATFPTRLVDGPRAAAEVVASLGPALQALDDEPSPELLEVAAQLTHLTERTKEPSAVSTARRGLAHLARLAGDDPAAADLERGAAPASVPELASVMASAEAASSAGSWSPEPSSSSTPVSAEAAGSGDDPVLAARFVVDARGLIIDDSGLDLLLLPQFPTAWRGGNVEVHQLPTRHGRVSFGIRWHGARPALLWDREGGTGTIRCPGLDPDWSTTESRGETLLAGSADGLIETPGPGDSFS